MKCATCYCERVTANPNRPPHGWKRRGSGVYCPQCWQKAYLLRAVIIPVAEPLSSSWDEFNAALRVAWTDTTAASNWIMTELYVRDCRRNGEAKMPRMQTHYLYPELRQRFPGLTPQSVTAIEQAVTAKYRKKRYDIVWTGACSLPTFRYPTPFPVHNQSWSAEIHDGVPLITTRIGDKHWQLRLKAGPAFRRQIADVKCLVSGAGSRGELALYRDSDRRVLCKLVAWLPRVDGQGAGVMFVRTGLMAEHFITAQFSQDAKDEAWYLNADHVRRFIHEYERFRHRLSQDLKAEQRPLDQASFQSRWNIVVNKQRNRMKSAVQEIAGQIVHYARRRRASRLEYTDKIRDIEPFPWFNLAQRLQVKCHEYGIEFVHQASTGEESESRQVLASELTQ